MCRGCNLQEETQTHVLEECIELNKISDPITKEMLFEDNIIKLQNITRGIEQKWTRS